MRTTLLMSSLLIHSLSKIVILMTLIHFLFANSYDHAIIISTALCSLFISEIMITKSIKEIE